MVEINNIVLKRTLKFLVSMSLVSLLLFFSLYQNSSFNLVYHRFPIFSHTLERKYMFLICNGILAILAKSSVSNGSSSSNEGIGKPLTTNLYVSKSENNDEEVTLEIYTDEESLGNAALIAEEEQQEEENSMVVLAEEEEEEEKGGEESESLLYVEEDETDDFLEEQKQEEISMEDLTEEIEEEEEEEEVEEEESNEELRSREEMNRRFEEFIRKMKEEIRIEAQSQLISV